MRERESDWNIPFLNYSVFYLMASVFLRAPTTKWTLVECSQMKLTETSSPTKKGVKNNTLFNLKKGVLCHACDGLFADEYLDHSSCPHAAPVAEGICDPVEADGGSSLSDGRRKNIIFEGKRWKKYVFSWMNMLHVDLMFLVKFFPSNVTKRSILELKGS